MLPSVFRSCRESSRTTAADSWGLPCGGIGLYAPIILLSVIAYLPATNNFFISDDFTMLAYLKTLDQNPASIMETPSEFFRLMSYVYFWTCWKLFGPSPELFYWAGIGLHAVAGLLVYSLTLKVTKQPIAAWAGALFFAAYERHQEAVMWISAANETVLTINCLLFLLLWHSSGRLAYLLSLIAFLFALFSKEASIALLPVAVLSLSLRGHSWKSIMRRSLPLFTLAASYVYLWLSLADHNFFVTDGHYAVGLHAIPIYLRSLARLVLPIILFLIPIVFIAKREPREDQSLLYFGTLLIFAIIPYSFLTYSEQIPSRNTYFPSVGLSGIVGVLFATICKYSTASWRQRGQCAAFLVGVIFLNVGYIWIRKEPQYLERSAPTRQLLSVLNGDPSVAGKDICVSRFPLHPWIGQEAVAGFTALESKVVFSDSCDPSPNRTVIQWQEDVQKYVIINNPSVASAPPGSHSIELPTALRPLQGTPGRPMHGRRIHVALLRPD